MILCHVIELCIYKKSLIQRLETCFPTHANLQALHFYSNLWAFVLYAFQFFSFTFYSVCSFSADVPAMNCTICATREKWSSFHPYKRCDITRMHKYDPPQHTNTNNIHHSMYQKAQRSCYEADKYSSPPAISTLPIKSSWTNSWGKQTNGNGFVFRLFWPF